MSDKIKPIANFDEVTEVAINMPGCKALLQYIDKDGKKVELQLDDIRQVKIETDAVKQGLAEKQDTIETNKGSIEIKTIE
ncbi:TPA: hypothetical protein ACQYCS_001794 [Vibrio parahaemolyticus]|uniref:hypothetical protein n=1 Tax=Vibrio parahaemolyticus TaxID=670 RepID=UPI001D169BB4|nr:hypothetical protein [Vibrio parahaemolyticus]MCC3793688.1 hypothetical protein [Vibrio parahaemolyticus]